MNSHSKKSFTLLELIIAIILLGILALGFTSIDLFARRHAVTADQRARLQNEVSLTLEHMAKNIINAVGNRGNPPLQRVANVCGSGFVVRLDVPVRVGPNTLLTPSDYQDDLLVYYLLSGNNLISVVRYPPNPLVCSGAYPDPIIPNVTHTYEKTLSTHIVGRTFTGIMPAQPADNVNRGFYINLQDNNTTIEVGLIGRWIPTINADQDNPQVIMKSRFHTRGAASN
jgi:prepilin-type N-terminal cleavage/methylation domain-containing protein